jgi:hypothetical protein
MKEGAADCALEPFELDAVVSGPERGLQKEGLEIELEYHRQTSSKEWNRARSNRRRQSGASTCLQ